jgi:hypothetical protein
MKEEEKPPSEAELREAELIRRALEEPPAPGRDLRPVDDALGAVWLVRASRDGKLSELRARAVLERAWPRRSRRAAVRAGVAAAAILAAVAAFLANRPRGPAALPAPSVALLRAELAAARPGAQAELAAVDAAKAAYRAQVFETLRRTYGGWR